MDSDGTGISVTVPAAEVGPDGAIWYWRPGCTDYRVSLDVPVQLVIKVSNLLKKNRSLGASRCSVFIVRVLAARRPAITAAAARRPSLDGALHLVKRA